MNNIENSKIAVIGDCADVLVFNVAGIRAEIVENSTVATAILDKLSSEGYSIIFLTQALASQMADKLYSYRKNPFPIVISLPDWNGSYSYSKEKMAENMEKAIGINLLNNK